MWYFNRNVVEDLPSGTPDCGEDLGPLPPGGRRMSRRGSRRDSGGLGGRHDSGGSGSRRGSVALSEGRRNSGGGLMGRRQSYLRPGVGSRQGSVSAPPAAEPEAKEKEKEEETEEQKAERSRCYGPLYVSTFAMEWGEVYVGRGAQWDRTPISLWAR